MNDKLCLYRNNKKYLNLHVLEGDCHTSDTEKRFETKHVIMLHKEFI